MCGHLDLAEVDGPANQLIVLRELFTRRKLDEDFAQLPAITAARPGRTVKPSSMADTLIYPKGMLLFSQTSKFSISYEIMCLRFSFAPL